jgi:hypothetical protein
MRGAGGTPGGAGQFVLGLAMMVAGGYLFLRSIAVTTVFGLGYGFFSVGSFEITGGMVLAPFIFGVGLIFYNSKRSIGWILAAASLIMLTAGILASIRFTFRHMNAFDILTIFVLLFGGAGLFFRSLKER